ncbi:restriction endonuclease [Kitasatospora sp. NBC_00374]|uniref:restriction endonuclease n=1 Tax=Kitasatospora sp. NBC_00374 TaxID=2975964 RepID=UPI0030E10EE6
MARRHGTGVLGMLAAAQREQHRQAEEQRKAAAAAQARYEREQRSAQRAAAQGQREALRAYQQAREADAARRTAELDARVAELRGILARGLAGPAFRPAELMRAAEPAPFDPGQLGEPVPLPDQSWYHVVPPTELQARDPGIRRQYEERLAHARSRFEHDWYAAQAAEQQRLQRLAEYRAQYDGWAAEQRRSAAAQAEPARRLAAELGAGSTTAVAEYFETALAWRGDWPDEVPQEAAALWDPSARLLVVDCRLPDYLVVPALSRYRYVKVDDREAEVARSATERKEVYREVLAQCALRVLTELFRADADGLLDAVTLNGYVEAPDPATGRTGQRHLLTVTVARADFQALALDRVEPVSCLVDGLGGRLSARPEKLVAVPVGRTADPAAAAVPDPAPAAAPLPAPADGDGTGDGDEPDLFAMDPLAFEELVAELFRRRGFVTRTTARSGDQGVDVVAEDPDPITGGQIVIQAKRYRGRVDPTAVRDLDATRVHHGANKGILVTTATFGKGSRDWVKGKPLTLVDGAQLVELLHQHGLRGRLGAKPAPAARSLPAEALAPGQNTVLPTADLAELSVSFSSAGAEADLTLLLLTADGQVRGDDDFVFYHQPNAAAGAVTLGQKTSSKGVSTETAAIRPATLPAAVHRIAVSVNMDTDSGADCGQLRRARLEVRGAAGTGWAFIPPADPAVSAMLVAEVYRHRAGTPQEVWKLRAVGQGWADGLAGLARAHGVQIA